MNTNDLICIICIIAYRRTALSRETPLCGGLKIVSRRRQNAKKTKKNENRTRNWRKATEVEVGLSSQSGCQLTVSVATWCPTKTPQCCSIVSTSSRTWNSRSITTTLTRRITRTSVADSSVANRRSRCIDKSCWPAVGKSAVLQFLLFRVFKTEGQYVVLTL